MAFNIRENIQFVNGQRVPPRSATGQFTTIAAQRPTTPSGVPGMGTRSAPSAGAGMARSPQAMPGSGMATTGRPGVVSFTSGPSIASEGRARTGLTIAAQRPSTPTGVPGMGTPSAGMARPQTWNEFRDDFMAWDPDDDGPGMGTPRTAQQAAQGMSRTGRPGAVQYQSGPSVATEGRARTAIAAQRPATPTGVPGMGSPGMGYHQDLGGAMQQQYGGGGMGGYGGYGGYGMGSPQQRYGGMGTTGHPGGFSFAPEGIPRSLLQSALRRYRRG